MVKTVRPNASETPTKPIPISGKPAANTALPHPPKTYEKVPKNSATFFFIVFKIYFASKVEELFEETNLLDF